MGSSRNVGAYVKKMRLDEECRISENRARAVGAPCC